MLRYVRGTRGKWSIVTAQGQWGQLNRLDRQSWICLLLAGAITSVSYLLLFRAVKLGKISQVVPLDRLNVVTGANGSGKSNLYRALRLLALTAQGRVTGSLAREGGLDADRLL